jgi:hypothetical protein
MFERFFQWGLRNGTRILFGAALIVLIAGLLRAIAGAYFTQQATVFFGQVFGAVHDASLPFFAALVVHRLEMWRAPAAATDSTWLLRNGTGLVLTLSLVFFVSAIVALVLWLREMGSSNLPAVLFQGTWLGALWSASLLFAGALILHTLNRHR